MPKPLNKTELAVAKAINVLRKMGRHDMNTIEAALLVQLGRSNSHFDYDMFEVYCKEPG